MEKDMILLFLKCSVGIALASNSTCSIIRNAFRQVGFEIVGISAMLLSVTITVAYGMFCHYALHVGNTMFEIGGTIWIAILLSQSGYHASKYIQLLGFDKSLMRFLEENDESIDR